MIMRVPSVAVLLLGLLFQTASAEQENSLFSSPYIAADLRSETSVETAAEPVVMADHGWLRDVAFSRSVSAPSQQFYVAGIVGSSFATSLAPETLSVHVEPAMIRFLPEEEHSEWR